jgi:hypothetical protein
MSDPNNPDTDFVLHINGQPVVTLSVEEDSYYTIPDTTAHAVTVAKVELFDPDGVSVLCFELARTFAIPKGEVGFLTVRVDGAPKEELTYMALQKPAYVEERRDLFAWDRRRHLLHAANS